jgi:capsule polysaccharide export protein KpsE/RkpR
VAILGSNTVQNDLVRKFELQKRYGDRYLADARRDLAKRSSISEDMKSGIISVSVTDRDPQMAARMAQEYVNELNYVVTHINTSSAHRERVFLDQRLQEVKRELESAEQQFSQFASKNGAINIPAQGKAMVEAAATLQGQLIAAESELQGFRQIYTDNNVRVRSLQARVNELRRAIEKIGGKGSGEKTPAQQLYPSLRELPLLGVTYADLLRRTKVEEAIFETLTQEDELAKVEEAREVPSVKVLDAPEVPTRKSFPPRLLIMTLGTVLVFVLGTTWVLANSVWEAVDPSDPRKAVAIEVWADVHAQLPWHGPNGSPNGGAKQWLRNRFHRPPTNAAGE